MSAIALIILKCEVTIFPHNSGYKYETFSAYPWNSSWVNKKKGVTDAKKAHIRISLNKNPHVK